MPAIEPRSRIRFESFEMDLQTRELRKQGRTIKLQDQPGKLLALLACRAGELVTRAEIEKTLWREGEFVEFEHAINTAMRKIREALGDDLDQPRFIETLPRKGYRFIAAVEDVPSKSDPGDAAAKEAIPGAPSEFVLPRPLARFLFLAVQTGYLAIYAAVLYGTEAADAALTGLLQGKAAIAGPLILVAAMCGIAVRLYLISAVGFNHPAAGDKFQRLFPALFILDTLWALSPLLLVGRMGFGLSLGAVAALAYLPFSQRTLMRSIFPTSTPRLETDK